MTAFSRRTGPRILAVGEVLWDLLPEGPQLGGAPANFAVHAHALGGNAALISRIGDDALGAEILKRFREAGLPTELIQREEVHDTGTVHVELSPTGQPRYHIIGDVAWDHIGATDRVLEAAASAAVICFGTLAQRTTPARDAIQTIVRTTPETAWRICDINLREPFVSEEVIRGSLAIANVLKLNDGELPVVAELYGVTGDGPQEILPELAKQAGLRVIALTCGSAGSVLWKDGEISEHPGAKVTVQDTIGAGDAFTAVLALGLIEEWSLEIINDRANRVAAYVCSHSGATPPLPPDLIS